MAPVDDVARPAGGPIRMQLQSIPAGLRIPDPGDGGRMLFPAVDIFGSPLPRPAQDRAA